MLHFFSLHGLFCCLKVGGSSLLRNIHKYVLDCMCHIPGTISILGNVHLEFRQMGMWKQDYEAQKWMGLVQIMSTGLLAVLLYNA
jgi:hypothetical protein